MLLTIVIPVANKIRIDSRGSRPLKVRISIPSWVYVTYLLFYNKDRSVPDCRSSGVEVATMKPDHHRPSLGRSGTCNEPKVELIALRDGWFIFFTTLWETGPSVPFGNPWTWSPDIKTLWLGESKVSWPREFKSRVQGPSDKRNEGPAAVLVESVGTIREGKVPWLLPPYHSIWGGPMDRVSKAPGTLQHMHVIVSNTTTVSSLIDPRLLNVLANGNSFHD